VFGLGESTTQMENKESKKWDARKGHASSLDLIVSSSRFGSSTKTEQYLNWVLDYILANF